MKYFVVTEIEFQYNDETYYTTENEAGEPVKVFTDKAKAEAYVEEHSIDELRRVCSSRYDSLGNYGWGVSEISNDPEAFEVWWRKNVNNEDPNENCLLSLPEDLSDDKLRELASLLSFEFHKITEVHA